MKLLYSDKVSKEFADKVISIADKLSFNPNWLMWIMNFETGGTFSPSIENTTHPVTGGNATGLIQFLPSTAISLGTTVSALKNMSAVEQLDWVYKYLKNQQDIYGKFYSYHDLYLSIFYPKAIAKNDEYVLGIEKGSSYAQDIAQTNPAFDLNKDLKVTKGEFKQWLDEKSIVTIPIEFYTDFFKKKISCSYIKMKSFFGGQYRLAS